MNKIFSTVLAVFLVCSCHPTPCATCPSPAPAPTAEADAGPMDAASRTPCQRACGHYRYLKCDEGKPTADGATCETVCENMQASKLVAYDLTCGAKVKSCPEIGTCSKQP